jgi:uncharacterized protein (TIGR03086 family)
MTAEPFIDGLARAIDATGELIASVEEDQWSNSTPCPDFNARALINHLVFGNRLFSGILSGDPPPPPEDMPRLRTADQLGADPFAAHRDAGAALLAAFKPGVLERIFLAPFGAVPGLVMLHIRITEELVHGWDLAQATAQPARLPDDLAEVELGFSRGQLDMAFPGPGASARLSLWLRTQRRSAGWQRSSAVPSAGTPNQQPFRRADRGLPRPDHNGVMVGGDRSAPANPPFSGCAY